MLAARLIATPPPGTVIGGKYRVERPLGSGGMGALVVATHIELHQEVAIKVLLPSIARSEESTARFLREGRAAARLTSPYAAKVFDTGRLPSGEPYLVMELLSGCDLSVHMTNVGRVPLEQAAEWVRQAAHALGEAHKLNVIHRDVKPANLFLAETSAGTIIKVLDFGVSKQVDDREADLTNTASVLGTPRYMAPEQMRSARLADQRCDVWSLGVVLYELTTGESPFRGDSVTALCFDVMERTPIPPSHHNAELPRALDAVIAQCLAKDPDERFPSMEALAESLRSFLPSARNSLPFASAEVTPTPEGRPSRPSATPAPTIGLGARSSSPAPGHKWLAGVVVVLGLAVAVAVTLTFAAPGLRSATAVEPSALAPPHEVVALTGVALDRAPPIEAPGPDVMLAPSAATSPTVEVTVDAPLTSAVPSATARGGAPRRPPGPLCDPPTWKDKNGRLVPKPYCL